MSPRSVLPVSAPPRVHELLRAAPDGLRPVVHRGRHAIYVDVDGRCVGLVDSAAAQVPCALRSRSPQGLPFRGDSAYLRGGVLHLDGTPLVVGRIADVRVARFGLEGITRNTADSVTSPTVPPAAVAEFVVPLDLPARLDAAAAGRLVGRGEGLTPLGDDILCGWLATHRAAGIATPDVDAAVRSLLPRTTLLSATLLDCALHGEVLPELAAYLASLGTPDETSTAATLAAVGHTSGAGLLHGARLALSQINHLIGAAS